MFAMISLPQEILETIAFHALQPADIDPVTQSLYSGTKEDAIAIRLVCTTFAALLQPLNVLFGHFNLHATTRSVENLHGICQSPCIRDRVTSVCVWHPLICEYLTSVKDFDKAVRKLSSPSLCEKVPPHAQSFIKHCQPFVGKDYCTKALAHLELLPRLYELQTDQVMIYNEYDRLICPAPCCIEQHNTGLRLWDLHRCFNYGRHMADIVHLATALAPRIRSLTFGIFTRDFHATHGQIFQEPTTRSFWQNLVELSLKVDQLTLDTVDESIIWDDFYDARNDFSSRDCSPTLEPILSNTPSLEVLSISPSDIHAMAMRGVWTARNIDWKALYWPKLRQFSLDEVMAQPDEICTFLERHSSTLRVVRLDRQVVGWTPALGWYQIIQVIAKSCTLDEVYLSNRSDDFNDCRRLCVVKSRQELEDRATLRELAQHPSAIWGAVHDLLRDEYECAMNFELRDYLLGRKKGSQALRDWWWSFDFVERADRRWDQDWLGDRPVVDPATTFL